MGQRDIHRGSSSATVPRPALTAHSPPAYLPAMSANQPVPPPAPTPYPPIAEPNGSAPRLSKHNGQRGLKQAYAMRDFAANEYDALSKLDLGDQRDRLARSRALKDLFSVWDGCRIAIRVFKGQGQPKPVTAANDPSRRKRKHSSSSTPPPPTDKPVLT